MSCETTRVVVINPDPIKIIKVIQQGPTGPAGPVGPQGPQGPEGAVSIAQLDSEIENRIAGDSEIKQQLIGLGFYSPSPLISIL